MAIRTGAKRKWRGTSPGRQNVRPLADDQLAALQPHRRDLPEALRLAPEAGTPFGNLYLCGALSFGQHEAGQRYAMIVQGYLSSIAAPRGEFPQGKGYPCRGSLRCGQGELEPPCECRRRKLEYDAAFEALAEAGHRAQVEVSHVAVHGRPCASFRALCRGLNRLEFHLLTKKRKNGYNLNM